ncbi:MAG: PIN domain-containing protein [Desulfobacterales bacterium]|nr:PIN domain-containing protein [Desulfobacterales bacterium]
MKDLNFPVPVFFDSDVMIAGSASAGGASFALLQLAELGLIKGYVSVRVLEECRRNLAKKLPGAIAPFENIVERCVSITTTQPDKASLSLVSNQAHKKDVSILASAFETKAQFLVTFNVKDYWPHDTARLEVLTPGELLSCIRLALNKESGG